MSRFGIGRFRLGCQRAASEIRGSATPITRLRSPPELGPWAVHTAQLFVAVMVPDQNARRLEVYVGAAACVTPILAPAEMAAARTCMEEGSLR